MDIFGRAVGVEARFLGTGEEDIDLPRGMGWRERVEENIERPREEESLTLPLEDKVEGLEVVVVDGEDEERDLRLESDGIFRGKRMDEEEEEEEEEEESGVFCRTRVGDEEEEEEEEEEDRGESISSTPITPTTTASVNSSSSSNLVIMPPTGEKRKAG
ncbi:hypothetical protein E2C01_093444 [Portunus trituberculatus]|uniref:Uncharacterized protein n=1 Tax=Portunus trituberculatus TaxID=210409 RepID=A0A5B7JPU0_PORTR|nr:hypothetical protein [Portunus trituberculatus]